MCPQGQDELQTPGEWHLGQDKGPLRRTKHTRPPLGGRIKPENPQEASADVERAQN